MAPSNWYNWTLLYTQNRNHYALCLDVKQLHSSQQQEVLCPFTTSTGLTTKLKETARRCLGERLKMCISCATILKLHQRKRPFDPTAPDRPTIALLHLPQSLSPSSIYSVPPSINPYSSVPLHCGRKFHIPLPPRPSPRVLLTIRH